jgi:type IV pilus assembly protein PilM
MFPSLFSGQSKKRSEVLSIDLGQHSTKAVWLGRKGDELELRDFALRTSPFQDSAMTAESLGEHLKAALPSLESKLKKVCLVLGVNDSLVRQAEMPLAPVGDMRLMLKYNSKTYLQQELPDYVFDCQVLGSSMNGASGRDAAKPLQKVKTLVGGARQGMLQLLQQAARNAGVVAEEIVPAMICPANAFERAFPESSAKEAVALVDIGFKTSSITILLNGEMALNRVVSYGSDKLTSGLAEILNVPYAEAESQKLGLTEEVQTVLHALLMPLGRELRASIDFFEHQQDRPISHVWISGGSARSTFIVDTLQSELMVPSKSWSPLTNLQLAAPPQKLAELEQVAPQLAVCIGAALSVL